MKLRQRTDVNMADGEINHPSDQPGHHQRVSAKAADLIREWHEVPNRATEAEAEAGSGQVVTYLGKSLVVPPDVHPVTDMSHLLGEAVLAEVQEGERVLDMGTGSGVNAILAASTGAYVSAVDINPHAVDVARENTERSGLADRIEVHRSDLFDEVVGQFDVIVYNPPFRWFTRYNVFEAIKSDENYHAVRTFFRNARQYLTRSGRMLIFLGSSGDVECLKQLAEEGNFRTETAAQEGLIKDGLRADYFAFRLTPV
jgi:release factor glutamine methyltransferase